MGKHQGHYLHNLVNILLPFPQIDEKIVLQFRMAHLGEVVFDKIQAFPHLESDYSCFSHTVNVYRRTFLSLKRQLSSLKKNTANLDHFIIYNIFACLYSGLTGENNFVPLQFER